MYICRVPGTSYTCIYAVHRLTNTFFSCQLPAGRNFTYQIFLIRSWIWLATADMSWCVDVVLCILNGVLASNVGGQGLDYFAGMCTNSTFRFVRCGMYTLCTVFISASLTIAARIPWDVGNVMWINGFYRMVCFSLTFMVFNRGIICPGWRGQSTRQVTSSLGLFFT